MSPLSEGPHTLYVQETDGAQWSESGFFEIVVDTTAPTVSQSYVSSGGTLAIFQYNEVLDGASVPSISEFTINHGASATAAYIVDDKVILKLDKTLTAVDQVDGNYVDVQVTYSGSSIIDMAGNEAATFTDRSVDINNSNRYPLTFLISDGVDKVECGAWKIEQDSSGVITGMSAQVNFPAIETYLTLVPVTFGIFIMPLVTVDLGLLVVTEHERGLRCVVNINGDTGIVTWGIWASLRPVGFEDFGQGIGPIRQ